MRLTLLVLCTFLCLLGTFVEATAEEECDCVCVPSKGDCDVNRCDILFFDSDIDPIVGTVICEDTLQAYTAPMLWLSCEYIVAQCTTQPPNPQNLEWVLGCVMSVRYPEDVECESWAILIPEDDCVKGDC
jgi:hypothetical protein